MYVCINLSIFLFIHPCVQPVGSRYATIKPLSGTAGRSRAEGELLKQAVLGHLPGFRRELVIYL